MVGLSEQDTDTGERGARLTRARPALWVAVAVVAVLAIVVALVSAARHGSSGPGNGGPGTVSPTGSVVVTFDDHGLHVVPSSVKAGIIEVGFTDRRTHPTGSDVELYYEDAPNVGGDLIAGPGGHPLVLLCAHRYFLAVRVDGVVKGRTPLPVTGTSSDCRVGGA